MYKIILLITPPQYDSIKDYINKQKQIAKKEIGEDKVNFSIQEIRVGNENGCKMTVTTFSPQKITYPTDTILFKKGNIFLMRQVYPYECWPGNCEIFNQMLSTFRFLE